eukprot:1222721-Prymnesium_polylepis.1
MDALTNTASSVRREPMGARSPRPACFAELTRAARAPPIHLATRDEQGPGGVWLSETDGAEGPGEPQKPDFTVCSYGPVRAPAERPPCPGSIPPLKRPLRCLLYTSDAADDM